MNALILNKIQQTSDGCKTEWTPVRETGDKKKLDKVPCLSCEN